jgi:hypothetical protein
MTKSKQILAYKEANPTHKPSDVAKACGVATAYVYQVLHKAKHKVAKKPVVPTEGQITLRKEIKVLNEKIEDLNYEISQMGNLLDEYRDKVREMKLHHGGLEYIISYLESRLTEKNGATV